MPTVLITGGSSGIGEVISYAFAKNGADVFITYKSNKTGAEKVIEKIKSFGRKAFTIQADLIYESDAKKVVNSMLDVFSDVDILVNNAGRYIDGDEWNASSEIWMKSLQQNLLSTMNVSKYVADVFIKKQNGIMVNIASRFAASGQPDAISYGAAKAGVVNVTQAYAKLLAPFGRANTVSPGAVNVGYWLRASKEELELQGKLIDPEDVAKKVIFLCSDEAKNINGQNFSITA